MTCLPLVLALVGVAAPETDRCVVSGAPSNWDELQITPAGGASFTLALVKAPVSVVLEGTRATITVTAPLRFEASAVGASVPIFPRRVVRLLDGVVTLSPRTRLVAHEARGASLLAHPAVDRLVSFDPLEVPCAALTLGDAEAASAEIVAPPEARRLLPTGRELHLRPAPEADAVLRLALGEGGSLMLERRGALGDSIRVAASWSDGTRVVGWTSHASVRASEPELLSEIGGIAHGLCGSATSGVYQGPAILHGGATVYDGPDGHAWAKATRSVSVTVTGDAGWVRLDEVPGLAASLDCQLLEHAFVHAEDLTFPR